MTPATRLNFLVDLRKKARLTQKQAALRFGLDGTQSYKSVAAWEKGENPPEAWRRPDFIHYLWDDLRLRREPAQFEQCWEILTEVWSWAPLNEAERARLGLAPPANQSEPQSATATEGAQLKTGGGAAVKRDAIAGRDLVGRDQYNFYGPPQLQPAAAPESTLLRQFSELYQQAQDTLDAAQLEAEISEYLGWLVESTASIELRGVAARGGEPVNLDLETIFVPLRAEIAGQRQQQEEREIALDQVLTVGERLAVIGGPGSGKSTVLQYIAWVLATALLRNDGAWARQKLGLQLSPQSPLPPLPLLLPLSAYARQRFRSGQNGEEITFPEFIQRYLKQSHCNISGLPADFFKRLLDSGRSVILLLDGLDEVADESQREIVTQTIQNLVSGRNQRIRVVVTCRSVAYKGQAVLARGFRQVTVQPLAEEHVEALVRQAYKAAYPNPDERTARTTELLNGIERLEREHARRMRADESRLINSPLLVRMLLVVHLNDRQLPQHRADLYKRFVDTMLKAEHVADRTVAANLRTLPGNNLALMSHLAFAMHNKGEEQGRDIELDTLRTLLKPDYTAETAAFVHLIHLRGTLVEERNGYYRFLHLAFQEYLAARHLAEVYWPDKDLKATIAFLAQQAPDSWWREVFTLLPGYLREASPPRAKRVLYALARLHEWQPLTTHWQPDIQLAALEIAATATLEWFAEDQELRQQLVELLIGWFHNPTLLQQTQPRLRALAGRALAELGDPRFDETFHYLPKEPLLGLIEIPAGTFWMGSDEEHDPEARDNETPRHQVDLPAYYIAGYPVTVAQFRAYLEATGTKPRDADSLRDPANHPVRYVTWYEATAYCAWLDKTLRTSPHTPPPLAQKLHNGWQIMLPSEAEWEKAARGTEGRRYPWPGETIEPTLANYEETGIGSTSTVGCFPAGASPEGVAELIGNVWEWTRSLHMEYPYPSAANERRERERLEVTDNDWLVLRGGSYYENVRYLRAAFRLREYPGYFFNRTGFRVGCMSAHGC